MIQRKAIVFILIFGVFFLQIFTIVGQFYSGKVEALDAPQLTTLQQAGCDIADDELQQCAFEDIRIFPCLPGISTDTCKPCTCATDPAPDPEVNEETQELFGIFSNVFDRVSEECPSEQVTVVVVIGYSTVAGVIIVVIIIRRTTKNVSAANSKYSELENLVEGNVKDVVAVLVVASFWGISQVVLTGFGQPNLPDIITSNVEQICDNSEEASPANNLISRDTEISPNRALDINSCVQNGTLRTDNSGDEPPTSNGIRALRESVGTNSELLVSFVENQTVGAHIYSNYSDLFRNAVSGNGPFAFDGIAAAQNGSSVTIQGIRFEPYTVDNERYDLIFNCP